MTNFQRVGSKSNAHVGRDFEIVAESVLADAGIIVERNYSIDIGIDSKKKAHCFDLGSSSPPILVECKSHRWTSGNNVPSAKITVWNEAMYYFAVAPHSYRKIFFVLRDVRTKTDESLAEYYVRTYRHLVPSDVEVWEYDQMAKKVEIL